MSELSRRLVDWYDDNARDLPWRRTRDPYAVWVSEVMLQQTRVETVIPYYHRFLERFPTATDLAAASVDEVLTAWAGLGYYRRARALWLAAREVTDRHGGRVPDDEVAMRSLTGVGPYTTGAVLSIAYGRPLPVVDGNVIRVMSRVFALAGNLRTGAASRALWHRVGELVPADRPGDFNQALMELGATVCTPKPRCPVCPLASLCEARARGAVDDFPSAAPKRAVPAVRLFALVARSGDRTLLGKRSSRGLFAGMWEPPMVEAGDRREARRKWTDLGIALRGLRLAEAGSVRHVLTHRIFDVSVWSADAGPSREAPSSGAADYERFGWVRPDSSRYALSTLARRVLAEAPRS